MFITNTLDLQFTDIYHHTLKCYSHNEFTRVKKSLCVYDLSKIYPLVSDVIITILIWSIKLLPW